MKRIFKLCLLAFSFIFMVSCSGEKVGEDKASQVEVVEGNKLGDVEDFTIRVGVPKAPPTLPLLKMKRDKSLGDKVNIELEIWDEPESLIAMVQGGDHDIFAFPLTVVSKLYNKGMDLQLMNVNTWGVTSFVTSDKDFQSWSDLKGKTVYVPLQSSPPDVLTQYFLEEAGLKVGEDVEIKYGSVVEIAQLLIAGKIEYASLIEPQVTNVLMKNPDCRRALSFEDEWQRVNKTDTMIPNAGIGGNKKFLEENKDLAASFQKEYKKALNWTLENPKEAGKLAEETLGLKAGLVEKAIPSMGLYFSSAEEAKEGLDIFYKLLFDFDPKTIGGKIPDEGIYYEN